jgi:hypothetical protein
MELSLEHLASQEREMSSSGEKLTQTEQTLRDLDILEAHAQVSVY